MLLTMFIKYFYAMIWNFGKILEKLWKNHKVFQKGKINGKTERVVFLLAPVSAIIFIYFSAKDALERRNYFVDTWDICIGFDNPLVNT